MRGRVVIERETKRDASGFPLSSLSRGREKWRREVVDKIMKAVAQLQYAQTIKPPSLTSSNL